MFYAAQKREIRANVEVRMAALLPEKPRPVRVIHEAICKRAIHFVAPQVHEVGAVAANGSRLDAKHSLEHFGEVPQVVGVVALRGRRQEVLA